MSDTPSHQPWQESDFPSNQALRKHLAQIRRALDPSFADQASNQVCRRLLALMGNRPGRVGVYLAGKGELSLDPLIDALSAKAQLYAPRILDGQSMQFARLPDAMDDIALNRYGLREPPQTAAVTDVATLDWLLMPLLGFDHMGHRLGMGGGYYDRALAECRDNPRPRRIGVGFEQQQVERLSQQPWDVPCHAIVTPAGWYHCGVSASPAPQAHQAKETPPWPTG